MVLTVCGFDSLQDMIYPSCLVHADLGLRYISQGRIQKIEKGGSRVMRAKRAKNFALATPTFG